LVLFDGQNVFDDAGSFAGGWHAHEAVDKLVAWKPVAPVVVALDHGGVARIDELTPFSDGRRGGKLDAIIGTVVDELLPRVHAKFELAYGPAAHFIGGSSLGGLAALYTHLKRPEVFGGAIAMSPSLWFTRTKVDAFVRAQANPYRSRIYLDAGVREGGGRMLPLAENLAAQLRQRGWSGPDENRDLRLMLRPDARGGHDERSWRRRFPKALRFLCEP
jgi:enterochelin esterase-like enzyme